MNLQIEQIAGEEWFRIPQSDKLRPFFMSIVSDSNHWMFISSNGGLTAGRKNADVALFPYYTDDKITELAHTGGSKTIFRVETPGGTKVWEPFALHNTQSKGIERNLLKNRLGNKVMFEEINHDLGLKFSYTWCSSNGYGFVRHAVLSNISDTASQVNMLDGIQNIMPYGVSSDLQRRQSNLVDAYKRSELMPASGVGIYALSAIIVDRAEPSEALKANVVWSVGIDKPVHLISSLQLQKFKNGAPISAESDVKGERGAYFLNTALDIKPGEEKRWSIVANVNQTQADVVALSHAIKADAQLLEKVEEDIALGSENLKKLVAASDGLTVSGDSLRDTRHFANTLFNIMRGGIFDENYRIEKKDFTAYLRKANKNLHATNSAFMDALPDVLDLPTLRKALTEVDNRDLQRLCREYLPLKFSRRHGDPSRPWNKFSINTRSEIDGSKILDYEGNWRDIFQNWEALVHSYPDFAQGMIYKFLNATTFEGYNPYRVTKDGFDWEVVEPEDPWSFIGYWGDHQIIYLLKFLEFQHVHDPGAFAKSFAEPNFVYANVPYRIKTYEEIVQHPKDTISFDKELDREIRANIAEKGGDAALLGSAMAEIHRVNFLEKILVTVLAKVSNFVPEAGIWLNTQRPEWNDANNALVGNGVSMVTLYYLRRFLKFFEPILSSDLKADVEVSIELADLFIEIKHALDSHAALLSGPISDSDRKAVTDALGQAGSKYRVRIYDRGFSGAKSRLTPESIRGFVDVALRFLEHSIRANRRKDGLYHAYNLISFSEKDISIAYLSEMLEGQVAVLSANYLDAEASLNMLDALRASALYRRDQMSYMLYPNKQLPGFLEKNIIPENQVNKSRLLSKMIEDGAGALVNIDLEGSHHFNGNFKNASDLKQALDGLSEGPYAALALEERKLVLDIFEGVFDHKSFTGRSGTFFGYEGLGSIYWHMVSKLHYAVMEVCQAAVHSGADSATVSKLFDHLEEIGAGIGLHKDPSLYGAFPTDPYSHTPWHRGAQQPGMTGQVKEDILVRFGELGVTVRDGVLGFDPSLLSKTAFSKAPGQFEHYSLSGAHVNIDLPANALAFSVCQVPVIYLLADKNGVDVHFADGNTTTAEGLSLDQATTQAVFKRSGTISQIRVHIAKQGLR